MVSCCHDKKSKLDLNSYLVADTTFPVAELISSDSFFVVGGLPGEFNAGVRYSTNLKFGGLPWN